MTQDKAANDYLYPYLEKNNLITKAEKMELDYNDCNKIKTEVMSKLKERLLSRAEII